MKYPHLISENRFRHLRKFSMLATLLVLLTGTAAHVFAGDYLMKIDLDDEEKKGGHTLERHVNVDNKFLYDRLKDDGSLDSASRYKSKSDAEKAINSTLKKKEKNIENFVKKKKRSTASTLTLDGKGKGYTLTRDKFNALGDNPSQEAIDAAVAPCGDIVVVIRPRKNMEKNDPDWKEKLFVLTSYPKCK